MSIKKVLAIETSCDETACAVVEGSLSSGNTYSFTVLSQALNSQAHLHAEFGGVYPTLAKREHIQNLVPLIAEALTQAGTPRLAKGSRQAEKEAVALSWLSHEPDLAEGLFNLASQFDPLALDGIAVTVGPGLEPALWVGINAARTLAVLWDKPFIPVNHMEGHLISGFIEGGVVEYPVLALLVSGGHTELVLSPTPFEYEVIGATRDDAAGEAFDKGARLLGLPYPGGRELSEQARKHRETHPDHKPEFGFPRPMIGSPDFDFSFSGLKTALLYFVRDAEARGDSIASDLPQICREYEDVIVDVLVKKTERALGETGARTLVVAGGVSANGQLRERIAALAREHVVSLLMPPLNLTGDNAVMIGMAGVLRLERGEVSNDLHEIKAIGNMLF